MPNLTALDSVRASQQALLWSSAGVACFSGVVEDKLLRIRWNASLRNVFGLADKQVLRGGPLFNDCIAEIDRDKLQTDCNALIDSGVPINATIRIISSGAERRWRVVAERIGHSDRVVGFFQQHLAEVRFDQVPSVSNTRWQSVGRLTLLDEMASAMAHELNQPLAAIATFAQAGERLLNLPQPRLEKAREVFSEMAGQALRAGDLIRHMRSLIKRHPHHNTLLGLDEFIKGFVLVAEPMARTHHVEFSVPTEIPAVSLLLDVTQVQQVLLILFQNALDAVVDAETQFKSIALILAQHENKVIFTVADSGHGIAANTATQLFQPFFSTKENGTGLGLISARNILESYGSHLEYANQPQRGCKFWFALPVC
jgi:C4-dicarboxylate-specific signal transduction histidine kinase